MFRVFHISSQNQFKLNHDKFLSKFYGKQPDWGYGGLSYLVYKRTYARPLTRAQKFIRSTENLPMSPTEEFWETCQRVVEGIYSILCQQVRQYHQDWDESRAQDDAQEMFLRMWGFKWLPPGRGLWIMGTEALEVKGGASANNCGFVSTEAISKDFAEPFCALMDLSMLGVGMGFDVRGAGRVTIASQIEVTDTEYVIDDTREGWVDALRQVLNAFVGKGKLPLFNFNLIRPKGAPLSTFAGTASGADPLKKLLHSVTHLLLTRRGKPLTSTNIVDIMNLIGVCVVSGNIRRSAEIAIGPAWDRDFVALKDRTELNNAYDLLYNTQLSTEAQLDIEQVILNHPLNTHRWASNNSVLCDLGQDYSELMNNTLQNGEPGFAWMDVIQTRGRLADPPDTKDSKAKGFNPCAEQVLWADELCTLVETFPTKHLTLEDYKRTLQFAYLYAKVVTCIPTHRRQTNAVMNRNRRIGTSMAGIFEMVETLGMPECIRWWNEGYNYLRELDADYSGWMGVPESIRITSVKPGGTVPLLAGVEGGMKVPTSRYYLRSVRLADDSPYLKALQEAGYRIEVAAHEPNTMVVYFPVKNENVHRTAAEVTLWEQAALAASLQRYWSDNMVSCTLQFQEHEKQDVIRVLGMFEGQFKAVSFLPYSDHGYEQAVYTPITEEQYNLAIENIRPLNLEGTGAHEETDKFCSGDRCEVKIA